MVAEGASFPDAVGDVSGPPNDLAELRVELEAAALKLTVRYAQPLDILDSNYGAVFIDTDRDPDTPVDPFQFGADGQIMFLLMDGYAKASLLAQGQTTELSAEQVAAKADGIEFTLPFDWVGGSPNFRLFATSAHLPEGSQYDRAPDAGWWDTETGLVVVPRPGNESVHVVYEDPAGDATMPDLTRVEERVRNGNVEFWFTFAHGVEPGDLPAWATMLDLAVRMDLDHRLWSGYRNDDEWPPTFGIERTLEVSFGRLLPTPMASLEYVRPSTSANPTDVLLPDVGGPGLGSPYNDSRVIVGSDARLGTARNQIYVSFPLAFLGYDDGEMSLRVRGSRPGTTDPASFDQLPNTGALDTRVGLSPTERLKPVAACADPLPPDPLEDDLDADSGGGGVQGDEILAIRGCALQDGGLRLTFDLKSLEPSDLAFINVYLDTDGNAETGNGFRNGSGTPAIGVDCLLNFKIAATPTPSLILASLTEFRVTPLGAGIHNVAPLVTPHLGDVAPGGQPGYCVNLPAEILQSPPGVTIRFFAIAAQQFYSYEPGETQGDNMDIGVGHPLGSSEPFEWVPDTGFISVSAPKPPALTLLSVVPNRGPVAGGTEVRLYGSAFPRNAVVRFDGLEAETQFVAPGELRAKSPVHTLGTVDVSVGVPGGTTVTRPKAFTFGPAEVLAPTVTGVEPSLGGVGGGEKITITGLNFQPGATVRIGAAWATETNVQSAFKMTCVTPGGALGAADVTVTNPDGKSATLSEGYAYGSRPPEIWTLYPNFGSVAGGTPVAVIGEGFLSGATATLGGVPLTGVTVLSDRMLRGTSGAQAAGLADLVVSNSLNGLSRTRPAAFAYGGADGGLPTPGPFTGTMPLNVPSAGGVLVRAVVPGVQTGAAVLFGGYPGRVLEADPATALVQVLAPPHAAGFVEVTLVNPDGKFATLPVTDWWKSFTYGSQAPSISSLTIAGQLEHLECPTTGSVVDVRGNNFSPNSTVDFDGVPGKVLMGGGGFQNWLKVIAPPHPPTATPPGKVTVRVTNPDGQSAVYVDNYMFSYPPFVYVGPSPPPPALGSVQSNQGNQGSQFGGETVTLTGQNFFLGARVLFDQLEASNVVWSSATSLTCVTPPHARGAVEVTVVNLDNQSHTVADAFTYVAPLPVVTTLAPTETGPTSGGTNLYIGGSGFLPESQVFIGGSRALPTRYVNATTLWVTVPPGFPGKADVTVVNPGPGNRVGTKAQAYTYVGDKAPPPQVAVVSPDRGPVAGGTPITVSGQNFLPGVKVWVGGKEAAGVTLISPVALSAMTPSGVAGVTNVIVANNGGQSSTNATGFTYVSDEPPTIQQPPVDQVVMAGATATFSVQATGSGTLSYQWFKGDVALAIGDRISGAKAATLTIINVVTADAGTYRVLINDSLGGSAQATANLSVQQPPSIIEQPQDVVGGLGGTATFSVTAAATEPLTYQWQKDNGDLSEGERFSGVKTRVLTITNLRSTDAGAYRVRVTNAAGQTNSQPAVLTVLSCHPPPEGLVAWWPMDGNAADWIGTNEPTVVNGLSFVPAQVRQGVRFSTGSILDIPDSPELANPDFTIELWARPDGPGPNPDWWGSMVIAKWSSNNSGYALFWRQTDGRFVYYAGGLSQAIVSTQAHPAGTFYHVAMTREGTAYRLYVDGVLAGEKQVAGDYIHDPTVPWTLGGGPPYFRGLGYPRTFIGVLDEVTMYRRALRADEIAALHAAGAGGKCGTETPALLSQPLDQYRLEGETAVFSGQAVGAAPLAYQWRRDGQALTDDAHYSGTHTNTLTILDLTTNLAGVYRLEVSNAFGQIESTPAHLVVLRNQPLPRVWAARDVGSVGTEGQVAFDAGTFVIAANGTNIAGAADAFRFVCQPLIGDGEIRAWVSRLDPTDPEAVAGLMIREGLSPGSAHAFMGVTAGRGSCLLSRSRFGIATTSVVPDDGVAAPCWVNLRRHGEWLAGYRSTDGAQWTLVGAARVPMTEAVQVGLAVSSHVADGLTTAVFEQVEVISGTPALTGGLKREGWNTRNELDHSIAGWQTNPQYGGPPLLLDVIPQIEVSATPPGLWWNHYGERISGYVVPPVTGEYVFYLASDDESELWLSPNADPAQRQKMVEVTAATAVRAWPLHPSAPIQLEAGRPYAFEILHVQHWVGSYLGVAWKLPNGAAPATGADPIAGTHLAWHLASSSAPALRSAPADQSRFVGTEANFSVHAQGAPPLRYRWQKDGVALTDGERLRGADTACLTVQDLRPADAGLYRVTVSNGKGELLAGPARLTVVPPPSTPALSQSRDFLSGGDPGVTSYTEGVYAIQGSSRFVYAPLTGDGGIVARLTSFDDAKTQYTAGLGVLEKLDPTTAALWLLMSGNQSVVWSYRPTGGTSTSLFGEGRVPCWLQVTRQGPWFTTRKSLDGVTWELVNRFTNSLPLTVQMGLSIGTGAVTNLTSATFDSVQLGSLAEDTRGGLLREAWAEGGYNISNLVDNPTYPNAPISQSIITQFLTDDVPPGAYWHSYGQRLSGYLVPPVTGDYVFYLGGDNAAQLWLSSSSDPAGKQLIAEVTTATAYLDWNSPNGPTRSNPIHLEAGQWRYLEVLHVQQWESSWVGVNWKRPDTDMPVVGDRGIPGRYLAYALPGHEAPVIVQQPADATRGVGDTVAFGVLASGTPPLFYQWRKGNTDLTDDGRFSGTKTRELTIANLEVSDSGYYSVVVTNAFGRTNSVAAGLNVKTCEPAPSALAGWWPGDGNPTDLVGDAHGTNQGGVFYSAAQVGQGFTFDSNDDRVVIPHRDAFNPAEPGFTVQFWMKGNKDQPEGIAALVEKSHGGDGTGWAVQVRSDGRISFAVFGASAEIIAGIDSLDGQWHHVVGVWDGTNTLQLYVDAVRRGAATMTTPSNNSRPLNLGFWWSGGRSFRGQIDELAIHNRALGETEIAAAHLSGAAGMCKAFPPLILAQPQEVTRGPGSTAAFSVRAGGTAPLTYCWAKDGVELKNDTRITGADTATLTLASVTAADVGRYTVTVTNPHGSTVSDPAGLAFVGDCYPPPTSLVGWWPGDGSGQDSAGGNHATNTTGVAYTAGWVDQSFAFDSNNDRLIIPHRDAYNPTAHGFTVQFWLKGTKTQPGASCTLVEKAHGWVDNTGWAVQLTVNTGSIGINFGDGSSRWPGVSASVDVLDNQWHHYAATWDGTTIRHYVDAVPQGTAPLSLPVNNSRSLNLGFTWGGGNPQRFFRGQIDEVAIHDRALSADEITLLHTLGAQGAGFCKSPAILEPPGDLSVSAGDPAAFTVTASGGWPLSYQWFKDNAALTDSAHVLGATAPTLTVLNAQPADAGLYSVEVSNSRGSVSAGPARLTVTPPVASSDWFWGRQSTSLNDWTEAWAATTDAAGNAYVSGTYKGVVDFGTNRLIALAPSDFFLAKYGPDGAVQWARQGSATDTYFTNLIATAGYGVVVDSLGYTYVAGSFAGTNFPHGVHAITSKGDADIFLAKYDPAGMLSHTWTARAGGTGWDAAQALAIDGHGNLYVTGQLGSDRADFGGNVARRAGGADVFIAKYTSAGVNLWVRTAGGPQHDMGYGIAVNAEGNAYVTGYFEGRAWFGDIAASSSDLSDVFLARYNSAGTCEWVRSASGPGHASGFAVALVGADRLGITGYFQGETTFGATTLPSPGPGHTDLFVAEYDGSGNVLWARAGGGTNVYGRALASNAAGELYLTGILGGRADFDGHPLASSGAVDLFLAAYDPSGVVVWNRPGGQSYAYANALACDTGGNLIAAGAFHGQGQFGPDLLTHANGLAAFVAKAGAVSTENCVPAPSGLLGWWPGDSSARDMAGSNPGTLLGGAGYADGNVGQAFRFDGVDDAVDLGTRLVLGPAFTEMAWLFSQVQDDTWHGFLGYEPPGGKLQRAPGLWVYQHRRLHAGFGDGSNWNELTTDPVLRPNAWNHVAVTFDRTNYVAYVNGVAVLSTNTYKGRVPYATPVRYIGRANDFFAGLVDEVAIFGRALTPNEIASIHAAGQAGMCADRRPVILAQPQSLSTNAGAQVTLSVQASGALPLSYQWWKDDTGVPTATNAALVFPFVHPTDAGAYVVVVQNPFGAVTSAPPAALTVTPLLVAPRITTQPADQTATAGSPITLLAEVTGTDPLTCQWFKNGAELRNATLPRLEISSAALTDAGNYFLWVTNVAGAATSRVARVTVNPVAPFFVQAPASQSVRVGQPVTFEVRASGTPPLSYQWWKDSHELPGATRSSLVIPAASTGDAGAYSVRVANAGGTITSTPPAVLTVLPPTAASRWVWASAISGTNSESIADCATAPNGDLYFTGAFLKEVRLGSLTLTSTNQQGSGFIARYNADGTPAWARAEAVWPGGVASDGAEAAYVSGTFPSKKARFGDQSLIGMDFPWHAFLAISDRDGGVPLAEAMGGGSAVVAGGVALDGAGNPYLLGGFAGRAFLVVTNLISQAPANLFVARCNRNGLPRWAKGIQGARSWYEHSLAVDPEGNAYVAGWFEETVAFDGTNLVSQGGRDLFVAKYANTGALRWARSAGGSADDAAWGLAVDPQNNVYVTGYFSSSDTAWGSTNLVDATQQGDGFLAKYDTGGRLLWVHSISGGDWEAGYSVATDATGAAYVTGEFESPALAFGSVSLNRNRTTGTDLFVLKYNPSGGVLWAETARVPDAAAAGETGAIVGKRIRVDGAGDVYVTGSFQTAKLAFGDTLTLTNAGPPPKDDAFVAKLSAPTPPALWVGNVAASQRLGTRLVEIDYDLRSPTGSATVQIAVSADGGATWTIPVSSVTGEVGSGIASGNRRHLVWDLGADWPGQHAATLIARVTAGTVSTESGGFPVATAALDRWRIRSYVDANRNQRFDAGEEVGPTSLFYGGRTMEYHAGYAGEDGILTVERPLTAGTPLWLGGRIAQFDAKRPNHGAVDGKTLIVNVDSDLGDNDSTPGTGEWNSYRITLADVATAQAGGIINIRLGHVLCEWNLVVASEIASSVFLEQLKQSFEQASALLYDATDGQMKFGKIAIYGGVVQGSPRWESADISIFDSDDVTPRAWAGYIFVSTNLHTYLGRTALGSPPTSPWYARTIVHEFGHYAFNFSDEYHDGNRDHTAWTMRRAVHPEAIPTDYGIMDHRDDQYPATEFSSFNDYLPAYAGPIAESDVAGRAAVTFQLYGNSLWINGDWNPCWRFLEAVYERSLQGAGLNIVSPPPGHYLGFDLFGSEDRPGPTNVPAPYAVCEFPATQAVALASASPEPHPLGPVLVRTLRVDKPVPGVQLVRRPAHQDRLIALGSTDASGGMWVYDLSSGDELVAHAEGRSARQLVTTVDPGRPIEIQIESARRHSVGLHSPGVAHLGLIVSASGRLNPPGQVTLRITADQALSGLPGVLLHPQDGAAIPLALTALNASNFVGTVALGNVPGGSVELTTASVSGQPLSSLDTLTLQTVAATNDAEFYSRDGRLEMRLPGGAVTTDTLCVVYAGRAPAIVPPQWTARRVGPVLAIALGDAIRLNRGEAALDFCFRDSDLVGLDRSSLRLYRWKADTGAWQPVPTLSVPAGKMLSATTSELGVFALFAEPAHDITPPAAIADLSATTGPGSWTIALSWTAPGDDGWTGTAAGYLARFSTAPITADNWADCAALPLRLVPGPAGTQEFCTSQMPDPGADYYFAVRAQDETGNLGPLSNLARAQSNRVDTDGDGLPDIWEFTHGLNPFDPSDAAADPDGDGLTNVQEFTLGTRPGSSDSDGDGLSDGWERQHRLDPTSPSDAAEDPDADSLTNAAEFQHSTNPQDSDTDHDGLPDAWEVRYGLCPFSAFGEHGASGDPDQDGRGNLDEYLAGTDPIVSVRPEFGPCELLADGRLQLIVLGQVGRHYEVQVSDDLVHWAAWTDFLSTSTTTILYDTPLVGPAGRFYRLVAR